MGYQNDEYALHLAHAMTMEWYLRENPDVRFVDGSPEGIRAEVWRDPISTLWLGGVTSGEDDFLSHRWDEYEALRAGDDS